MSDPARTETPARPGFRLRLRLRVRALALALALAVGSGGCGGGAGDPAPDLAGGPDGGPADTLPGLDVTRDAAADLVAAADAAPASDAARDAASDGPTAADVGSDALADAAGDPCRAAAPGAPCDDGDPQTLGDVCAGGRCVPGPYHPVAGACGPARPIGCNAEVAESTVGAPATVTTWGCAEAPALPGGERVFAFTAPYLVDATAALVTDDPNLRLALVRSAPAAPAACEPAACASVHPLGAGFTAVPGEVVWLVVDGLGAAPPWEGGAFRLGVGCQAAPREDACGDGADDDLDGATDCEDPDCPADPHCDGGARTCEPNYLTACGLDEIWSTGSVLAVNRNENYACSDRDFSGREYVYEVRSAEPVRATARLSDPEPFEPVPTQQLLVLEGACEPTACVAADPREVTFELAAGRSYFLVVDAERGFEGFFRLTLECAPVGE